MATIRWWLDADYTISGEAAFALHRVTETDDSFEDDIIIRCKYADIDVDPTADSVSYDKVDEYIENALGFLPGYEIN